MKKTPDFLVEIEAEELGSSPPTLFKWNRVSSIFPLEIDAPIQGFLGQWFGLCSRMQATTLAGQSSPKN